VQQATVLFNPDTGETRAMRTKEDAHDYRYFPDPDLPPLVISPAWVADVQAAMPELPAAMAARLVREHGLSAYDAAQMTGDRALATCFDATVAAGGPPKLVANWLMGEIAKRLNAEAMGAASMPVPAATLAALLQRVQDGTLSQAGARQVLEVLWARPGSPVDEVDTVIATMGLRQVNDSAALEAIVDAVLAEQAKLVDDVRAGKEKALNALVGQAMKRSQGKANPAQLSALFKQKIG
jgi:aspartyl-tRNA(Asn)/glutamyl-tRNA(Gln) amidotransferase subunit B